MTHEDKDKILEFAKELIGRANGVLSEHARILTKSKTDREIIRHEDEVRDLRTRFLKMQALLRAVDVGQHDELEKAIQDLETILSKK